jgi:hypothetical protein
MTDRTFQFIRELIKNKLNEDVPTTSLASGEIAGTPESGDLPPGRKRKKYMSGGRGSRKLWMQYLTNK